MTIEVQIVDIGCGFCRVLKTAFDSRALDVAMYGGFIMGGIVAKPIVSAQPIDADDFAAIEWPEAVAS